MEIESNAAFRINSEIPQHHLVEANNHENAPQRRKRNDAPFSFHQGGAPGTFGRIPVAGEPLGPNMLHMQGSLNSQPPQMMYPH